MLRKKRDWFIKLFMIEIELFKIKIELKKSYIELGKFISLSIVILFSSPIAILAVAHSPTPSTVKIAAFLNGEGKKAAAMCERWCKS